MSDIKFDGEWVVVEGNWLRARTLDFMLDAPSRRSNKTGHRRALVHNGGDGLTINYASDYPGGVTIRGELKVDRISGHTHRLNVKDLVIDHPDRRSRAGGHRRALVHDFQDGLTINWAGDYPGGVTIRGNVEVPNSLSVGSMDVAATINELKAQIQQLRQRVADLENP